VVDPASLAARRKPTTVMESSWGGWLPHVGVGRPPRFELTPTASRSAWMRERGTREGRSGKRHWSGNRAVAVGLGWRESATCGRSEKAERCSVVEGEVKEETLSFYIYMKTVIGPGLAFFGGGPYSVLAFKN